jgi:mono/diheme cytochrome c family protein
MLRGADRVLELLGWALAVLFVVMMFAGPQVVAEDKPTERGSKAAGASPYADQGGGGEDSDAAAGEAVFTDNCGSCHTLSAAGTSGTSGPNLDGVSLDAGTIEGIVRDGRGGMPAFGGDLSDDEIAAVAAFVAGAR